MAQPIENAVVGRSLFHSLALRYVRGVASEALRLGSISGSLALFVSVLFVSELGVRSIAPSLAATPNRASLKLAQQPAATRSNATSADAERASDEAYKLYEQGTAESYQQAIGKFLEALQLYRSAGDKSGEAGTLNNIGGIYSDLGEKQKALEFYNQSLPLRRAVGDRSGEATALNNIGKIYNDLGEKQKALEFYNQSLPLRRAVGDRSGEAVTLNNIGKIYNDLGKNKRL